MALGEKGFHSDLKAVINMAKDAISGKRWLERNNNNCAIITLDIKNAFNAANWDAILATLVESNVPRYLIELVRDYFKDRMLLHDTKAGRKSYAVTAGVPQVSMLEPILWNVMNESVLRLRLPREAQMIGFAEDSPLGNHIIATKFMFSFPLGYAD